MRPYSKLFTSRLNSLDDSLRIIHVTPHNSKTNYMVILIDSIWSLGASADSENQPLYRDIPRIRASNYKQSRHTKHNIINLNVKSNSKYFVNILLPAQ